MYKVIVIVAILTIVSMTVNVAKAYASGVQFTLEGLTKGPPPGGYTTGLVRGYSECEWIPFNLTIDNGGSTISLSVVMDLDYRINIGSKTSTIGIDAFGIDGTEGNRWKVRVINVTNGGTYDLGPYTPSVVRFPSKDVLRFSFELTVPANTKVWVLWENHLASTGGTNLFDSTEIDMGASYWPGARLHVQASLTGDVEGQRTVPIMRPGIPLQATISGVKFHDVDADGVQDPGEEGLADWTIQLFRKVDNDWNLVDTDITGDEGYYIFTVTETGTYKVVEVFQDGWMQTAPALGYYELDVELGDTWTGLDFGNIMLGSISGYKFYDANVNGKWDGNEVAVVGWKVHLTGINILGGTVDLYAFTDASGKFTFERLLPGNYTVTEVFPPAPQNPTWIATTSTSFSHELEEGEDYVGPDFGNVCLVHGAGGRTLGFWSNKNGQALITSGDVEALNGLNLYKPSEWTYPPFSGDLAKAKAQIKNYLLSATAKDMRWMLSAQLIATKLNVLHGFLDGSTIVYVGSSTYVPSGFISIDEIMANANTALGEADRVAQEYWKNLLDGLNNNRLPFVCPEPCYPIVYP